MSSGLLKENNVKCAANWARLGRSLLFGDFSVVGCVWPEEMTKIIFRGLIFFYEVLQVPSIVPVMFVKSTSTVQQRCIMSCTVRFWFLF
jgi:hypothetical protein